MSGVKCCYILADRRETGRGGGRDWSELSLAWSSCFDQSVHFPDWTRRRSLLVAGCGCSFGRRQGCSSTERDGGGQHPRPLPRNRDAIPAGASRVLEAPARRAHVDAAKVAAPPGAQLAQPSVAPGGEGVAGTDPGRDVLGEKVPGGKAWACFPRVV